MENIFSTLYSLNRLCAGFRLAVTVLQNAKGKRHLDTGKFGVHR